MIVKRPANRRLLSFMMARSMKALYASGTEDMRTTMAQDDAMDTNARIAHGTQLLEEFCRSLAKAAQHRFEIQKIDAPLPSQQVAVTDPAISEQHLFSITATFPDRKHLLIVQSRTGIVEIDQYFFLRSLIHSMLYLLHLRFKVGAATKELGFHYPVVQPPIKTTVDKIHTIRQSPLSYMPATNIRIADTEENFRKLLEYTAAFMTVTFYIRSRHLVEHLKLCTENRSANLEKFAAQLAEEYQIPCQDIYDILISPKEAQEVLQQAMTLFQSDCTDV